MPAGQRTLTGTPEHFVPGATAQLLDWFKRGAGPSSNAGIFELYRQQAEEHRPGQMPGPRVRRRAPRGVSQVQLFSGVQRRYAVAADATIDMTESHPAPLLRAGWVKVDASDLAKKKVVSSDQRTLRRSHKRARARRGRGDRERVDPRAERGRPKRAGWRRSIHAGS
jgi:hypothetical protein